MRLFILAALIPTLLGLAGCAGNANEATSTTPQAAAASPQAAAATTSPADDTVVATWDGGQLTLGDLHKEIESELTRIEIEYMTQRYQLESQALEQVTVRELLDAEAAKRGLADGLALLQQEIEGKVAPATDDEINEMYEVLKRRLKGQPLEAVRDQIAAEVSRRKQGEAYQVFVTTLKEEKSVVMNLPYPDLPRILVSADDDPSIGPEDAPITIIQFAEYQCPYCGKSNEILDKVMADYEGKVRMVYRDFPLSFHDRAIPAAVAANCAGEQGKYWEMHRRMMANQRALSDADLEAHANALELDIAAWTTCRADPKQVEEVKADMADGAKAGVSGTPAFFINGIMLSGAQPYSEFKTIIDRELAAG